MDTCGFPKDNYFYLKSAWTDEPIVHILPHWNWQGRAGHRCRAYSNCERVELFLNGTSVGEQVMVPASHLEWKVKYVPGELVAIGKNGSAETARKVIETTGVPYTIEFKADRTQIQSDGCDVAVIRAYIVDKL